MSTYNITYGLREDVQDLWLSILQASDQYLVSVCGLCVYELLQGY